MIGIYHDTADRCSRLITKAYSTSFSLGIRLLAPRLQNHICAIYGFVRIADEIVDSFHEHDKQQLLNEFKEDTFEAISKGISLNPVLHSFQKTVNQYNISHDLIHKFLESMEMDLDIKSHNQQTYDDYILGSAEVVGLMCLHVFCEGNKNLYDQLLHPAMKLGSGFQKVNFLRDIKDDCMVLGRNYFPGVEFSNLNGDAKKKIEDEIEAEFTEALAGIRNLPVSSRFGVYVSLIYYRKLLQKIKRTAAKHIMKKRIRVPNQEKYFILLGSYIRHRLNLM